MIAATAVTIDANVFVSALSPGETHYRESQLFLRSIVQRESSAVCPTLLLPEIAGAVSRTTGDSGAAERLVARLHSNPFLDFVSLDDARAVDAGNLAARLRLRGADAVYVASARTAGAVLVSWDGELLERAAQVVQTMTPAQWLAVNAGPSA